MSTINKCDKCQKKIEIFSEGGKYFFSNKEKGSRRYDLCLECNKPLEKYFSKFLKK